MDKILYCPGPFSTYNARFLYTQESDEVMMEKQKDIIELTAKYNIPLHIKVHPSGERDNVAHFTYLSRNYKHVKVIGGYWRWRNKVERLIPKYQLVIIDIIRTAIVPVMARGDIPCVLYTRAKLLKKVEGLRDMFHVAENQKELQTLLKSFSFGELYLPLQEGLLKKWVAKRETIQAWYTIGWKEIQIRRKFRNEWGDKYFMDLETIIKRLKRIRKPPSANNNPS